MTTKEYLSQYIHAERDINSKLEEIARLRSLREKVTANMEPDKVQASQDGTRLEKATERILELEEEVDVEIDRLRDLRQAVKDVILLLPPGRQRDVLGRYYLCGETFERVAEGLGLSERWAIALSKRAIEEIEKKGVTSL